MRYSWIVSWWLPEITRVRGAVGYLGSGLAIQVQNSLGFGQGLNGNVRMLSQVLAEKTLISAKSNIPRTSPKTAIPMLLGDLQPQGAILLPHS